MGPPINRLSTSERISQVVKKARSNPPNGSSQNSLRSVSRISRRHLSFSVDRLLEAFARNVKSRRALQSVDIRTAHDLRGLYERLENVAEALRIWHSTDAFLAENGSPKPLP